METHPWPPCVALFARGGSSHYARRMPRDAEFPQRCRDLVQERLVELGYTVERDSKRSSGRLRVSGAVSGFAVYVACVNGRAGYPMWLERRLALSNDRIVMVVLFPQDGADPELYLVPTLDWRSPQSPLVNPQYPDLKERARIRDPLVVREL